MFTWFKNLLGVEQPKSVVSASPVIEEIKTAVGAVEVVETPAPAAAVEEKKVTAKKAATKHTRAKLESLTKAAIDELAKAELGVDLDRRKTKESMIDEFLAAQKKK